MTWYHRWRGEVVRSGKSCRRHVLLMYTYLMLNCQKLDVLDLIHRDGSAWRHNHRQWWSRLLFGSLLVQPMLSWSWYCGGSYGTCCHVWMCDIILWYNWCTRYVTCHGWRWRCCVGAVQVSHLFSFSSSSFSSSFSGLVYLTPWLWPRMWLFWVSLDSGNILFTFLMFTRCRER